MFVELFFVPVMKSLTADMPVKKAVNHHCFCKASPGSSQIYRTIRHILPQEAALMEDISKSLPLRGGCRGTITDIRCFPASASVNRNNITLFKPRGRTPKDKIDVAADPVSSIDMPLRFSRCKLFWAGKATFDHFSRRKWCSKQRVLVRDKTAVFTEQKIAVCIKCNTLPCFIS